MSPELRKAVIQGMINLAYNHTRTLIAQYEEIRDVVKQLEENPSPKQSIIRTTALEVLDELESRDHMSKLQVVRARLESFKEAMVTAATQEEFADIYAQYGSDLESVDAHFSNVIPVLCEKMRNAMRQQVELN